jgi:hypothetical protein
MPSELPIIQQKRGIFTLTDKINGNKRICERSSKENEWFGCELPTLFPCDITRVASKVEAKLVQKIG